MSHLSPEELSRLRDRISSLEQRIDNIEQVWQQRMDEMEGAIARPLRKSIQRSHHENQAGLWLVALAVLTVAPFLIKFSAASSDRGIDWSIESGHSDVLIEIAKAIGPDTFQWLTTAAVLGTGGAAAYNSFRGCNTRGED